MHVIRLYWESKELMAAAAITLPRAEQQELIVPIRAGK